MRKEISGSGCMKLRSALLRFAPVAPVLFTATLAASCANQAPPSGGPEDKTPPAVAARFPENGQLNVDTRASVEIKFSEWINRASAAGAVSVYPAVPQGVAVTVKKNRLTVTPKAPLSSNTTYHVSISAALQDLHGNAISAPVNTVFSTGATLDSGRVEGAIVALKQKTAGHKVMLFRVGDSAWTDGRYFSLPDYAAQSDSAGTFSFSHIREGRYRFVAFTDQYRTGKLRVGDSCFTSLETTVNVTKLPQTIRLYPAESDTSAVKKNVSADSVGVDTSGNKLPADTAGIAAPSQNKTTADTAATDTVDTFQKKSAADTSKNRLMADTVNTFPQKSVVDTLGIIDTSKNKRAVDTSVIDTVNTSPKKRAAEKPKKLPADSICIRLSGGASCLPPDEKRKWVYRPNRRDTVFTVADSAGTFAFDSIPASKGTLLWFIDANGDNQITPGRLSPWRSPERFFALPDTVEAKARWFIEGLEVRACETPDRR
jgi:hypothetical protein